jgi:hypothetical protein
VDIPPPGDDVPPPPGVADAEADEFELHLPAENSAGDTDILPAQGEPPPAEQEPSPEPAAAPQPPPPPAAPPKRRRRRDKGMYVLLAIAFGLALVLAVLCVLAFG